MLRKIIFLFLCILTSISFAWTSSGYAYDANLQAISEGKQHAQDKFDRYDDNANFITKLSVQRLDEKTQGGSFFAFEVGLVAAKGRVALDTNAIIARLEGSSADVRAVVGAIAGRNTNVSITAVKEFLRGGGNIKSLRGFLSSTGGGVGPAPSAQILKQLESLGVKAADARVVGSAIQQGIPVLTRDKRVLNKIGDIGERF